MVEKRDIRLAGIVQGQEEIDAVMRVLKTNPPWHVSGSECNALQKEICEMMGVKYAIVVNSGSSANLLAMHALNLKKRQKVVTSACGFPATLNPIIHLGLTPVLVDYNLNTLNTNLYQVETCLQTKKGIKALLLAHTLGNSLDMDFLMNLVRKYKVDLIEDCCEAMGTQFDGQYVGSFGKVSTISFYSSHQISGFGGGGAVLTNDQDIYEQVKSLRDWGKKSVREGYICTKMDTMVAGMPYDQQYTYSTIGYNMRFPDGNCAYARAQLQRLSDFINKRRENYRYLEIELRNLPLKQAQYPDNSNSAFFGYPIVLGGAHTEKGLRDRMVEHLENNGVHVRLFFAGNILKHDAYKNLKYEALCCNFPVADYLMRNCFFVGCWPGLNIDDMQYTVDVIKEFLN